MTRPKLAVLCDDQSLRQIESAVAAHFDVQHARDVRRLLTLAQNQSVTTVLVEQSIAAKEGGGAIEVLVNIRTMRPDARRVLLADHCNLAIIVQGIHSGVVERIIYKPVTAFEVVAALCPPAQANHAAPSHPHSTASRLTVQSR